MSDLTHAEHAEHAREILARVTHDVLLGTPDLADGRCDDCKRDVTVRWRFGKFDLCRACTGHRVRVRASLKGQQ